MRIAVITLGDVSRHTGGKTYLSEVLGPLGEEPDFEVDVHLADTDFAVPESCRRILHRSDRLGGAAARVLAEAALAARLSRQYDVALAPFNYLPSTWRGPSVAVLHNLLAFGNHGRDVLDPLRFWYRRRAVASTVRRATVVLAVSEHLRKVALEHLPTTDSTKIRVVPLAASRTLLIAANGVNGSANAPLVIMVGALWRYKRVDVGISAFAGLADQFPGARLVIAGPGEASEVVRLKGLARRSGVADSVSFLGSLCPEPLARLYREAHVLLALSRYESFGLHLVEAMALGLPVVSTRLDALVEVAGNAPLWVDADPSAESVTSALARVIGDDGERQRRIDRGLERAMLYDWGSTASATADAIRAAYATGARR